MRFTSVQALKDAFFNDITISEPDKPKVFWTLYEGLTPKEGTSLGRCEVRFSPEESWKKLESFLIPLTEYGGQFCILLVDKPKGTGGNRWTLETLPKNSSYQPQQTTQINGIGGGIYGGGDIQGIINNELEKERLKREIEDLKKEKEQKPFYAEMLEKHVNHNNYNPQQTTAMIAGIAGKFIGVLESFINPNGAKIAVSGYEMPNAAGGGYYQQPQAAQSTPPSVSTVENAETVEVTEEQEAEQDKNLVQAYNNFLDLYPQHEADKLILSFSEILKENPKLQQPFFDILTGSEKGKSLIATLNSFL